ncbi:MAG: gliding motility-associated C-terminal domain-containing protein [Sphingobacteriaceae bacterium]|nr:gliding motility-associated C-terminal domain-containing protein [Sphingobacteriaceae bacterium]
MRVFCAFFLSPWRWTLLLWLSCATAAFGQEICDNGVDDDANGLIDLNDSACICTLNDLPHIRNDGFELYSSLPTAISQMNRALNWHQATYGTSDYFNSLPGGFSPPNLPSPFPTGTGVAGFTVSPGGMENIGSCLAYPLLPGIPYTVTFSMLGGRYGGTNANPPIPAYDSVSINLYGRNSCPSFPLPGVNDCPFSHGFVLLGGVRYASVFSWQQFTLNFTPSDTIYSIIFGPQCIPPANFQGTPQGSPYFWIDDLQIILPAPYVQLNVQEVGNGCASDWELRSLTTHPPDALQWYFEGVALAGQTFPVLQLNSLMTGSGTYQVRATYASGCLVASRTVVVNRVDSIYVSLQPSRCGLPTGSLRIDSILGGSPPFSYSLNGAPASAQQFYPNLASGNYALRVSDALGCSLSQSVYLHNVGPPIQGVSLEVFPVFCLDSLGSIKVKGVEAGTPPFRFGLAPNFLTTDTVFTQLNAGRYVLYIRDSMDCGYQKEVELEDSCIVPPCVVLAPNIFTPNGDGINDVFGLSSDCEFEEAQWVVYNRWGELVFESRSWRDGWDGCYKGKLCESGGYVYYFRGRAENRTLISQGLISLVR